MSATIKQEGEVYGQSSQHAGWSGQDAHEGGEPMGGGGWGGGDIEPVTAQGGHMWGGNASGAVVAGGDAEPLKCGWLRKRTSGG